MRHNPRHRQPLRREQGFALLSSMVVVGVATIPAIALNVMSSQAYQNAVRSLDQKREQYVNQQAIELAQSLLRKNVIDVATNATGHLEINSNGTSSARLWSLVSTQQPAQMIIQVDRPVCHDGNSCNPIPVAITFENLVNDGPSLYAIVSAAHTPDGGGRSRELRAKLRTLSVGGCRFADPDYVEWVDATELPFPGRVTNNYDPQGAGRYPINFNRAHNIARRPSSSYPAPDIHTHPHPGVNNIVDGTSSAEAMFPHLPARSPLNRTGRSAIKDGIFCGSNGTELANWSKYCGKNGPPTYASRNSIKRWDDMNNSRVVVIAVDDMTSPACIWEPIKVRVTSGCFKEGTHIRLADGSLKPVEAVRTGDFVHNGHGGSPLRVTEVVAGPERTPLFKIIHDEGTLTVTGTHPLLTPQGVVQASTLTRGDLLSTRSTRGYARIQEIRRHYTSRHERVWNFSVAPVVGSGNASGHYFVEAEGVISGDLNLQRMLEQKEQSSKLFSQQHELEPRTDHVREQY